MSSLKTGDFLQESAETKSRTREIVNLLTVEWKLFLFFSLDLIFFFFANMFISRPSKDSYIAKSGLGIKMCVCVFIAVSYFSSFLPARFKFVFFKSLFATDCLFFTGLLEVS